MWQRARLEKQLNRDNEERAAHKPPKNISEEKEKGKGKDPHDNAYEVTLDENFLTSLEYGMPPASWMVW